MIQVWSRIPQIIATATKGANELVDETIHYIEDGCKMRSRVDTGQMRGGWTSEMTGNAEGRVYNDVEHTIFNELGTVHMAAQPMLVPSVEEAWPRMVAGARALYL